MKRTIICCIWLVTFCLFTGKAQQSVEIITHDVDNFWIAYDKIQSTHDSVLQRAYLNALFLQKGTRGLSGIMEVRQYTPEEYLNAINNYPLFWQSIRSNTNRVQDIAAEINQGIEKLRELYPPLRSAAIYFTVGAFRTNGTIHNGNVLIGSELALADSKAITNEFPASMQHLKRFFDTEPFKNIVLLQVHEYVHISQKPIADNLLAQCVYEGVAEFVSTKAMNLPSATPAIEFGRANIEKVRHQFELDIFRSGRTYDWLWSARPNRFGIRDLGYYIGYAICDRHYERAKDKMAAIKEMIELDYSDNRQLERFVDKTNYLSASISKLRNKLDRIRPVATGITPFSNGSKQVKPSTTQLTIHFSEKMDKNARGFELGPLGESHAARIKRVVGFSDDGKSITIELMDLQPNQKYQLVVSDRFQSEAGIPLKPYLIEFITDSL
jgi:hypothetical protein